MEVHVPDCPHCHEEHYIYVSSDKIPVYLEEERKREVILTCPRKNIEFEVEI